MDLETHYDAQKGGHPPPSMASRRIVPYICWWLMIAGHPLPVCEGVQPLDPPTPFAPNTRVSEDCLPPLGAAERERYRNVFANTGSGSGLLDGLQGRIIFLRSGLSNETLGQIWYDLQ